MGSSTCVSAPIFLAPFRSICSPCGWAARRRCCRFSPASLHTGPAGLVVPAQARPSARPCRQSFCALAIARPYRHFDVRLRRHIRRGDDRVRSFTRVLFVHGRIGRDGSRGPVSGLCALGAVQLATPDHMRGRVGSLNSLFVGASNELGEFRAGMTAGLCGTVPAVVIGGFGTLTVVALWMGFSHP